MFLILISVYVFANEIVISIDGYQVIARNQSLIVGSYEKSGGFVFNRGHSEFKPYVVVSIKAYGLIKLFERGV